MKSKTFAKICAMIVLVAFLFSSLPITISEETRGNSNNDFKVYLKYAEFIPPAEALLEDVDYDYYLLQLNGVIKEEWILKLKDEGVKIFSYVPNYTYIVYMEQRVKEKVEELNFVRWIGKYYPEYKISDKIEKEGEVNILISVFSEWKPIHRKAFVPLSKTAEKIENLNGTIIEINKYGFTIQAKINASKVSNISKIGEVEWIDKYGEKIALMDNLRVVTGTSYLHNNSNAIFNGTNIVGEIKDNGIDLNHPEFEGQIIGTDGSVSEESHGTSTFGIVFAKGVQERARGQMYKAGGVFCDWGVGRYQSIQNLVNNWNGVFQSNSWSQGSADGSYSSYSQEDDQAIFDFDITMLYAAGNGGGENTITQDGTAKNVITVGGLNHYDNQDRTDDAHTGSQGNEGPTDDGRIKPDLSNAYDSIYTTTSGDAYTSSFGGTSGATPITAGGVGLAYQMYKANFFGNNPQGYSPSASTIKALLIADAYQYDFSQADRFAQGWGIIDMKNVYDIGTNHFIENQDVSLKTGQSQNYTVQPTGIHPLKISLVWTDVPGTTSSSKHLINDLDLIVTAPNGTTYYGNYGLTNGKWSQGGGSADNTNNVENVFIQNPSSGNWKIEIKANNIAQDGNEDTTAIDQHYGLVVSGVIREQHDIVVADIKSERFTLPDETNYVKSTIANIGLSDESSVEVRLLVNNEEVERKIISLDSGTSQILTFSWMPTEEKTYNLIIEATKVSEENRTYNNKKETTIDVFMPKGYLLIDRGHGNAEDYYELFSYLYSLGYADFYTSQPINSSMLSKYDVFISIMAGNEYTTEEQTAVQDFVSNGGGLLVIGDYLNVPQIYSSLTDYAGITWNAVPCLPGTTTNIASHETTNGVSEVYMDSPNLRLSVSSSAIYVVRDMTPLTPAIEVAVSEYGEGRVVGYVDAQSLNDDFIDASDNRIIAENIIKWISQPIELISSDDYGQDSNNDGKDEYLVVELTFNITKDGDYRLYGKLYKNSELITTAENTTTLTEGIRTIKLYFNGGDIYDSGEDSPYTIKWTLYDGNDNITTKGKFNTTGNYQHTEFVYEFNYLLIPIIAMIGLFILVRKKKNNFI